jgi:hypothetical protein
MLRECSGCSPSAQVKAAAAQVQRLNGISEKKSLIVSLGWGGLRYFFWTSLSVSSIPAFAQALNHPQLTLRSQLSLSIAIPLVHLVQ